jgi:hypothetical protein
MGLNLLRASEAHATPQLVVQFSGPIILKASDDVVGRMQVQERVAGDEDKPEPATEIEAGNGGDAVVRVK